MSEQALFPDNWLIRKIGDIVDPNRRITYGIVQPGPRFEPEQGVPMIRGQNYSGGVVEDNDLYHVSPQLAASFDRAKVIGGDLLMSIVGYVGIAAEVPSSLSGANLTQTTARIAVRPELCGRYFLHFFRSSFFKGEVKKYMKGSAQPGLNLADVEKMIVAFPADQAECLSIADNLDNLDTAIRETEALIDKLKSVKQGLLHDLLTRGIDANGQLRPPQSDEPQLYKESPLGLIPREWELQELGDLAEVSRGKFTHRPRNDPAFFGGEYPFIQTGDVALAQGGYISSYSQTLSERGISVSQEFPIGTIAITIAANIADTAVLARPMFFPDSVVGAVVAPEHNIRFVELSIRRAKRALNARAPQSAQKNINLQDLRPLLIAMPSRSEQDSIAARYDALQARLEAEQIAVKKLLQEKSGLMDDLLTGRVRVTPLLESMQHTAAPTEA
jgi:type I restriction enzyme S subunit